ncbi:MAG: ClpXP protease specificity-enhancing factor SspB [Gammaproteobacteria bacterium]|nr:ClpXP protease specificity-enhancing factor SspB [Gammaproteobacteria bacterium]
MTSFRWYLVDALIRWLLDNECTPHVVLQTDLPGVEVPGEHIKNNRVVLNVSPQAVHNFSLGPKGIEFDARFGGVPMHVRAPAGAIVGVHAKESEVGFEFEAEESSPEEISEMKTPPRSSKSGRPHLRIVE